MDVSFDWYKIFYYVAQSGNITAAAERLYISQPAVSQSIRQLENILGCELFVRTSKGVNLTAEGKTLFQYVSKGVEQIRLGEKRLEAQLMLESGEICVGASDMTLEYFLLPYLEKFHTLYPKIRISVTNGPTPETLRKLDTEAIDFGVVSEPVCEEGGAYSIIPVREIEDIFICGDKFNEFNALPNETIPLERLAEMPLVMLEPDTSTRKYVDGFLNGNGINVLPKLELATSSLIVRFVERNFGVGCVVRDFAEMSLKEGSVRELMFDRRIPRRSICIVKKNSYVSKTAEKLLALLTQ